MKYQGMSLLNLCCVVFLVLCLECVTLSFGRELKAQESLYKPKDPILQVKAGDFNTTVFNKKKAYFVEFYSSWCGHCVHFAPVWTNFSYLIEGWRPVVELVAVNCALEENTVLCRESGVDAFPTMKYFKYNSGSMGDSKKVDEMLKDHENYAWRSTPETLAQTLAKLVEVDYLAQAPHEWPRIGITDPDAPLDSTSEFEYVALVFVAENEDDPSRNVGLQVILDSSGIKNIRVLMVTKVHSFTRYFQRELIFPALLVMKKDNGKDTPVFASKHPMTRAEITGHLFDLTEPSKILQSNLGVQKSQEQQPPPSLHASVDTTIRYQVHMTDLISGLSYMLRQEIPLKKDLTHTQLTALKAFLNLMTKYYPGSPPIRRLLFRMNEFLSSKEAVSGAEFAVALEHHNAELGRPLPKNTSWVACKGSEMKYRGYPCSLWTTFHALTVQAYKKHGKDSDFKAVDILEAVHGYVKNFFGCTKCSENFERAALKIPQEVAQPHDVILWLWKSHNRANTFTESDPMFPKTQFPPPELCPRCHMAGKSGHGQWDTSEVLNFMIDFYSDIKTEDLGPGYKVVSFDSKGNKGIFHRLRTANASDLDNSLRS